MSKAVSALAGVRAGGLVEIEETGLRGMITLRGDLSSGPLKKAVKFLAPSTKCFATVTPSWQAITSFPPKMQPAASWLWANPKRQSMLSDRPSLISIHAPQV